MSKNIGDFPDYTDTIDTTDRLYLFKKAAIGAARDQALYSWALAQIHNVAIPGIAANNLLYTSADNTFDTLQLSVAILALLQANGPAQAQDAINVVPGTDVVEYFDIEHAPCQNDIIAHAGGGQGSATLLTKTVNYVPTVATAADSVKLRNTDGADGTFAYRQVVINGHASNALQLFGFGTDTVNGAASGTGISLPAGKMASCYAPISGKWFAVIST